jgi:hypothetical protein
MTKFLEGLKVDLKFVGSHTLQPRWYKLLNGPAVELCSRLLASVRGDEDGGLHNVFFLLSLLVHMIYRVKTDTWKRSWLDFVVVEENGGPRPARIGVYYYSAVVLNAVLSLIVSQGLG